MCVGAASKGRSASHALNNEMRRLCAAFVVSGIVAFTPWIESKANPSDWPSSWNGLRAGHLPPRDAVVPYVDLIEIQVVPRTLRRPRSSNVRLVISLEIGGGRSSRFASAVVRGSSSASFDLEDYAWKRKKGAAHDLSRAVCWDSLVALAKSSRIGILFARPSTRWPIKERSALGLEGELVVDRLVELMRVVVEHHGCALLLGSSEAQRRDSVFESSPVKALLEDTTFSKHAFCLCELGGPKCKSFELVGNMTSWSAFEANGSACKGVVKDPSRSLRTPFFPVLLWSRLADVALACLGEREGQVVEELSRRDLELLGEQACPRHD